MYYGLVECIQKKLQNGNQTSATTSVVWQLRITWGGGAHSGPEGQNFGKISQLENIFMAPILAFFGCKLFLNLLAI